MSCTINKNFKTLFLIFAAFIFCTGSTFAVKSSTTIKNGEVSLNEKQLLSTLEKTKGEKLSFFEKLATKIILKKAKKKKRGKDGEKKGMAIASLVLGIVSILSLTLSSTALGILFLPAAILAVVFGAIAKKKAKNNSEVYGGHGMALAGLVCGIVALGLVVLIFLLFVAILGILFF